MKLLRPEGRSMKPEIIDFLQSDDFIKLIVEMSNRSVSGIVDYHDTVQYLGEKIIERDKKQRKIGFDASREPHPDIDRNYTATYPKYEDFEKDFNKE